MLLSRAFWIRHLSPALLAGALALSRAAPLAADEGPSLLVPAGPESAAAESAMAPPAPLIIPGRPSAAAPSAKSAADQAREKFDLGLALERGGRPAAAIAAYQRAVKLDPATPEANFRMGKLYLTVDQVQKAVVCFIEELRHHPQHTEAGRELGIGLTRLGDYPRAIRQLEILTRRNPMDAESWHALGAACLKAERPKDAEAALRRAIHLKPVRAEYRRDLGVVLAATGHGDAARAEYRRAIRLDPHDASVWLDLGNLERRERHLEAALTAYREAFARDSTQSLALQGQVETLRDLKREPEAGELLRHWLRAHPEDHDARLEGVRLFSAAGRTDLALELAREGVRAAPTSGDAHLVLAMALQWSSAARTALEEMRRAEGMFTEAADRARVRAVIASSRAAAPESLRALYAADSLAHPDTPAPAPRRGGP